MPDQTPKPGCLMPGLWLGGAALATLICGAIVGIGASGSESDGVAAANIAAGPFGFAWGGMLSAAIIHLAWKRASSGVRVGGPLGCGCLGAIVMIVGVVVFFAAIFPAL